MNDLALRLCLFSDRYLAEAADTIANMNWPVERIPFLAEERGLSSRQTWRGVTVRVALHYDVWNDNHKMQIDAIWKGHPC